MNIKNLMTTLLLLSNVQAIAGGFVEYRCQNWGDNLTQPQAQQRWQWAMRCDPANKGILTTFKNYTAPGGAVRPAYPIYGLLDEENYLQGPTNPLSWFPPVSSGADCYIPENYDIVGFCAGGCYTADQMILSGNKEFAIKDMFDTKELRVTTLSSNSTLDGLKLKEGSVFSYSKSITSGSHDIVNIKTQSAKSLSVTLEHPLVLADGNYIAAQDLKVGSKLLNEFGEEEIIEELSINKVEGKVYNIRTNGEKETDRVIVAGGLLNGDLTIQQRKAKKANQVLLRKKLVRGELIK
ncbi:Hint domain-containing protein [Halobacteriovorax sp. HLS]|uniref:Hint domain-containing protein n=1 Tax=Halobacteriovorax sp. HLS TaxID=2234000 RepID=UPI000FDB40E9|nr:Hint domain-containing protein [Halobacteriovorax sp. HLS]